MAPKLFMIGGESADKGSVDSVLVCDIEKYRQDGKWRTLSSMSEKKGYFGGALIDKKIYICGGCNLQRKTVSKKMKAYNVSTNSWKKLPEMPQQLDSVGVAAWDEYIIVSGGRDVNEEAVSTVYRYCIKTDRWLQVGSMPLAKYGHHLVELNGYLYTVGGYHTKSVHRCDPYSFVGTWTSMEDSLFEHRCPGVTTYDGKIYVHSSEGFEVYTPETNTWTSLEPAHTHFACSLVTVGDKIWSIGGGDDGQPKDSVFEFDPVTQRWSSLPGLDGTRQGHASFVIDC